MPKLKHIYVPAVIGFVLSFLISLIATHHFFRALMRAGIWAVACAALGALVSFIFEKFLSEGLNAEPSSTGEKVAPVGSNIDITISDEELTPDESGPQFAVSKEVTAPLSSVRDGSSLSGRQSPVTETERPVAPKAPVGTTIEPLAESEGAALGGASGKVSASSSGFTPVNLAGERVQTATVEAAGVQSASPSLQTAPSESGAASASDGDVEDLDELPEIGELNLVGSDSIVEDSDFAEEGARPVNSRAEFADGSSPASQDAETMAKAIRTLLKRED